MYGVIRESSKGFKYPGGLSFVFMGVCLAVHVFVRTQKELTKK